MYTIDIDIYSFIEYLEVDTHTNRHTQTHISSLSPTHTLLDCSFICFFLLTLSILVGRATLLPRSRRRGAAGASGQPRGCTFYSLPGCIRVSSHTPQRLRAATLFPLPPLSAHKMAAPPSPPPFPPCPAPRIPAPAAGGIAALRAGGGHGAGGAADGGGRGGRRALRLGLRHARGRLPGGTAAGEGAAATAFPASQCGCGCGPRPGCWGGGVGVWGAPLRLRWPSGVGGCEGAAPRLWRGTKGTHSPGHAWGRRAACPGWRPGCAPGRWGKGGQRECGCSAHGVCGNVKYRCFVMKNKSEASLPAYRKRRGVTLIVVSAVRDFNLGVKEAEM